MWNFLKHPLWCDSLHLHGQLSPVLGLVKVYGRRLLFLFPISEWSPLPMTAFAAAKALASLFEDIYPSVVVATVVFVGSVPVWLRLVWLGLP